MKEEQVHNLLYENYETELGGVEVYTNAVACAVNRALKEEWEKYLEQTKHHVEVAQGLLEAFDLDPNTETPGRQICRHIAASLVQAMQMAKDNGDPAAAEIVAAECVCLAETKDHLNWELIGELKMKGSHAKALADAHEEVEEEEDEHLYHTTGWTRELWIQSLGMPAVLPPPEEEKHVKTAIGAAKAKNARTDMI